MTTLLLLLALFGPLVGAALAFVQPGRDRAGRAVTSFAALATGAAVVLLVLTGVDDDGRIASVGWLEAAIDRISALLLTVVSATATVVAGFSGRALDDDGRAGRYFALIGVVATGSAFVIVPAAPAILVVGWLLSGWALVGLIGFARPWAPARRAQGRIARTLLVGDLALVTAIALAAARSDGLLTGDATAATAQLADSSVLGLSSLHIVMVLVVVAGASRSALVPFHRWLIGTLSAPTPVSALVHAGLVSGAGLLLIRFADPFIASDPAVVVAFVLGITTIVIATAGMLVRSDIKGNLAWSTVGQMAFMVVQCSVGAFSSAAFHIAGHGMYKASLFLGSGDTAARGLRSRRQPGPLPI